MKKNHRIALLALGFITFMIALYGSNKYMEIVGELFIYSIAFSLAWIAIRGE